MLRRGMGGNVFLIRGVQRDEGFLRGNLATLGPVEGVLRSEYGRDATEANVTEL